MRLLFVLRFRLLLSKELTLLFQEAVPACSRDVLAPKANKRHYVSPFREPLAVVAQAFLVPKQGQSRIGIQTQSLDIVPTVAR